MKKLFTLIAAILLLSFNTKAQDILEITNFKMGEGEIFSDAFTTPYFKCIGISTKGVAWAGTRYGGLYRYDLRSTDPFKGWTKSDKINNVYINDIKPDNDGGIWVAQSGIQGQTQVAAHVAGGINYFPNSSDYDMEFFSVSGTQTDGYLYTRNVKSLFIDQKGENAVWAVQGQSTSSSKAMRGGVSIGPDENGSFVNIAQRVSGWDWGFQATPNGETVGGGKSEVWVGVTKSRGKFQIIRYHADGSEMANSILDNSNVPALLPQYTPNAIYFDKDDNRWIGLKYGGIILKNASGKDWITIPDVSIVPGGFTINPNAITGDEFGNIYFGTTAGLLKYLSPDYNFQEPNPEAASSYKLYTTEDGLSNNNITGLAYDSTSGRLLVTSDAGVTFIKIKPEFIQGAVFDVYTGLKKDNVSTSGLKKIPEQTSTIKLYFDDVLKETTHADATGKFELKEAENDKEYTVEIEYTDKSSKIIKYVYKKVKNQTLLRPTLIPDSLIRELKLFKKEMEKRCFDISLFSIPAFSHCWDGFYVNYWDDIYAPFYNPGGINKDHNKKVENLANFFATMKTVYDLGGNANEFVVEGVDNAWAFLDMLVGMKSFASALNQSYSTKVEDLGETFGHLGDAQESMYSSVVKLMKESIMVLLDQVSAVLAPFPDARKSFDGIKSALNDGLDAFIEIAQNGTGKKKEGLTNSGVIKVILDQLKKVSSVEIAAAYYKVWYARNKHEYLIRTAGDASIAAKSDLTYSQAYGTLLNPESESILKFGKDTLTNRKADVKQLNGYAKMADMAAGMAQAASYLALVPGFQVVGATLKGLSWVAKGVQAFLGAWVIAIDAYGASETVNLSMDVTAEVGFVERRGAGSIRRDPIPPSQNQPVELLASTNNLNAKIAAFQAEAAKPAFDPETFAVKLDDYRLADSAHVSVTKKTMRKLLASTDSALAYLPDFKDKFSRMIDSFYSKEISLKPTFFYQQYAMVIDFENKADYLQALDSTATEMKVMNDSLYNNVERLINEINENGIGAPAYLDQSDYKLVHDYEPGSTGSLTYTYTNYGKEDMRNVSFKISAPTEGFTLTSANEINAGTIPAGESRQFNFTFSSPAATDSFTVGKYDIEIEADNGVFRNNKGSLIIINREALPVTMVRFEVTCSGANTELSWETASESNSSHFEVEKSSNGHDWTIVRRVNAAGNSEVRKVYRLQDKSLGNSFYRLKQVDKDGKFTYSDVAWSKCYVPPSMVSVYPVPANDVLHVVANASEPATAQLIILDMSGREVRRINAPLQAGPNTIRVKTADLSNGQYILRINGGGINKTIKITISK